MIALRWHVLRLPLLLSLLWCLLLFALFQWTVQREDENATELAQIQTRTLFSSIVNTRGWNADRGGVWATEQPNCQPNPWLPEDQRTLLTADGRRLVRFNPAYMTRQIAERFQSKTMNFHICGLSPKRPQNRPDQWETSALLDFDAGKTERFQLVPGRRGAYYRYMAPLRAEESCLQCHQRNKIGDVLGGISVSISAFPILASVEQRNSMVGLTFGLIGFIGVLGIGGATFQINRKKEQAEEANRAKSVFLSRMSHDIRTPMSAIIGLTAIAKKNAGDPERLNECIDKIALASQFQLSLVNDILDVSKIESGKMQLASEPFDLAGIIDDVTLFTSSSATAKGIVFETSVDPRIGRMYVGDPMRLKQILMNLLSNALKFVDENGKVTLRVESLRAYGAAGGCALHRLRQRDRHEQCLPETDVPPLRARCRPPAEKVGERAGACHYRQPDCFDGRLHRCGQRTRQGNALHRGYPSGAHRNGRKTRYSRRKRGGALPLPRRDAPPCRR